MPMGTGCRNPNIRMVDIRPTTMYMNNIEKNPVFRLYSNAPFGSFGLDFMPSFQDAQITTPIDPSVTTVRMAK
jgi:hypothetical protein